MIYLSDKNHNGNTLQNTDHHISHHGPSNGIAMRSHDNLNEKHESRNLKGGTNPIFIIIYVYT
jgi:hypothetical protein